jgi:uncharacterized protein YbjT (DUF2867 family)
LRVSHGAGASAASEEAQGKALVDASIANGVEYFVYSSVERGGEEKSWENPTPIPHFIAKHRIELHLRETAEDRMMWTILRPTAFMEVNTATYLKRLLMCIELGEPLLWTNNH